MLSLAMNIKYPDLFDDGPGAADFYKRAFGEVSRMMTPGGK